MKKLALFLGVAALALSACNTMEQQAGANWQAYHSEEGFEFYIDKNSIKPVTGQADQKSATVAVQGGNIQYDGVAVGSLLIGITADCAQNAGRSDRYAFYEKNLGEGKLIGEQQGYTEFKRAEIAADVAMINAICK